MPATAISMPDTRRLPAVRQWLLMLLLALVVLLPSAWLLARFGGLDAVWYSFLIAEAVSIVVALLSYRYLSNNKLAAMKTENE